MPAVLPAKFLLQPMEFHSTIWHIDLDKVLYPVSFDDLFEPSFWQHHQGKIKTGHLIRVVGQANSFDVMLVAIASFAGGISLETWPRRPHREDAV